MTTTPRGPLLSAQPGTPIVISGVYNAVPPAPADQQGVALQVDSEGNLLVNIAVGGGGGVGSNVTVTNFPTTQPVSIAAPVAVTGTFFQATQPVSGTVAVTQSTNPWIVAGSGTAGTAAIGVVTVQGIAGGTTIPVTASIAAAQTIAVTNAGTFAVQASITTLGQQLAAASVPVVLTAAQLSTLTPLSTVGITGEVTVNLNQVGGAAFALGQQLAASSLPVVLTASQLSTLTPLSTVAVTQSTSPWVVSNGGTFAVQATDNLTQVGGASFALGQQLAAASLPVVLTAAQISTLVPLSTVAVTQSTSPWVDNITQFGGVNIATGTGASGTGIPRVTVSNDSNILATQSGTWTVTANAGTNLNTSALQLDATGQASLVAGGGTTAPSKVQMVGGKTNSATSSFGRVQRITNATVGTTVTSLTTTINATGAGNLLVVLVGSFNTTGTSPTDNKSSTYHTDLAPVQPNSSHVQTLAVYSTFNTAAGITSVTVGWGTASIGLVIIEEWSGAQTSSAPFDQSHVAASPTSSWSSGVTAALAANNDLAIGFCLDSSDNTDTNTPTGGFGDGGVARENVDGDSFFDENQILSSSTGIAATGTITGPGSSFACGVVTYKATSSSSPQYDILPLGFNGRSVIIEGFSGGTSVPVSLTNGTVSVGNFPATQVVTDLAAESSLSTLAFYQDQILALLAQILAQAKYANIQRASYMTVTMDDLDQISSSLIQ